MNTAGRTIWQVAAGDTNRNYAQVCLDWGVILNGPGSAGPWPRCVDSMRTDGVSSRKISGLKRFCKEIQDQDLVVLRLGTTDVFGVGIVVGDYVWSPEFGDIDGWDLQHVRRVRWLWRCGGTPQRFETYALKLGDTVQRMDSKAVREWIEGLPNQQESSSELVDLPTSPADVTLEHISDHLFDRGMASSAIQTLLSEIGELIRIAKWYQRAGHPPSEHETVAYLVVPLLRALGWTPQTMAVEWKDVDVALFSHLPRLDQNLSVVVEAKAKDSACLSAKSQAQQYAEQNGREGCTRLIVTDGLRYGAFFRETGTFRDSPAAYLNLTRLRAEYPVYRCRGAMDAFLSMSPYWPGATGAS